LNNVELNGINGLVQYQKQHPSHLVVVLVLNPISRKVEDPEEPMVQEKIVILKMMKRTKNKQHKSAFSDVYC
jgi:hypothetical protein